MMCAHCETDRHFSIWQLTDHCETNSNERKSFNDHLALKLFTNGPRDQGSISGQVIPKTQKNST